jgi:hypothetical protein
LFFLELEPAVSIVKASARKQTAAYTGIKTTSQKHYQAAAKDRPILAYSRARKGVEAATIK